MGSKVVHVKVGLTGLFQTFSEYFLSKESKNIKFLESFTILFIHIILIMLQRS